MLPTLRRTGIGVAALAICLALVWTVRAQKPTTHNVALRAEQVSKGPDGRLVITAAATGDIRGALTLTVTGVNSRGSITDGEWVLVSTFIQDVVVAGHSHNADREGGHEHPGGELLVQRGSLSGKINGGMLTYDADGRVSALGSVQLSISRGSLTFDGVTSGTARLALTGLQDAPRSTGTAAFSF